MQRLFKALPTASRRAPVTGMPRMSTSDIKQTKYQTTAELDMYIRDLVRRCQFKQAEQESRKIDLLYHASAHFEVRKFVYNAKSEAHERVCQEYQIHKQGSKLAQWHPPQ